MTDSKRLIFSATDKEIFDAYMSAPQHFNEGYLLDAAVERGIFYSVNDSRELLADALSSQVLSYDDLRRIEVHFEKVGRADRRTTVSLDVSLTQDELAKFSHELVAEADEGESVVAAPRGKDAYAINVAYSEVDFGATRFRQRREREADLTIASEGGKTVLRMPSTLKARSLADRFVSAIEKGKLAPVPREDIDLSQIADPAKRTEFFTSLITGLPDSKLENVLRVRVERLDPGSKSDLDEDDETKEIKEEQMLSVVRAVALNGDSLLAAPEYQALRSKGFFITSMTWRVRKAPPSGPIIEYEAEFAEPQSCKQFEYSVRQWKLKYDTGEDRKSFSPIPTLSKDELGRELEETAVSVLRKIRQDIGQRNADAAPGGKV